MRIAILILALCAFISSPAWAGETIPHDPVPQISVPDTEAAAKESVHYCPMHTHIHGKKGDRCPICGMDLVPIEQQGTAPEEERKILYWYDPMVPGQKFDKPGKSPYMDMELVPFYEDAAGGGKEGAVRISPTYQQALGVKTTKAAMHEFGKAIHAYGHIAPNTRLSHSVAVRSEGWVVGLKTDAVGDTVKKGDLLFTYYSPDLMSAQSDYLSGYRANIAETRLRLNGMDDKAIAAFRKRGKLWEETPFYAPADGTVAFLNARKGAFMKDGDVVLMLQDYSQVWVESHVPPKDLPLLGKGTPAMVTLDDTGETFPAMVDYIYPQTDAQSRDGMARLVLDNPDGKLKTDMLVKVMFNAQSRPRLAVPSEAVLYGKNGGHVMEVLDNGYYRPVMVKTGITSQGMTEILSGLDEGAKVVQTGQFMIDAESNLTGGLSQMEAGHEH